MRRRVCLFLLALTASRSLANKKDANSKNAALLKAEAAAAADAAEAGEAADTAGLLAAASPTAAPTFVAMGPSSAQAEARLSAAALGVSSGRVDGPGPRVGYLELMPSLGLVDPLAVCNGALGVRLCAKEKGGSADRG